MKVELIRECRRNGDLPLTVGYVECKDIETAFWSESGYRCGLERKGEPLDVLDGCEVCDSTAVHGPFLTEECANCDEEYKCIELFGKVIKEVDVWNHPALKKIKEYQEANPDLKG